MAIIFNDLIEYLNRLYPATLAEEWDQVGIHFGRSDRPIKKVMTALDVRENTVQEAIDQKVDTIVVHHPILFSPIERFDYARPNIEVYSQLIKANINVFAIHTNFDRAENGMNDWLAQALDLQNIEDLSGPDEFGQPGLGRIGDLSSSMSREAILDHIKDKLHSPRLTLIEQTPQATYQRIALVGGSGLEYVYHAVAKDADIFITGDITYHKGQEAEDLDILTIDAGHYIESIFIDRMASQLQEHFQEQLEVIPSQVSTNPFRYY